MFQSVDGLLCASDRLRLYLLLILSPPPAAAGPELHDVRVLITQEARITRHCSLTFFPAGCVFLTRMSFQLLFIFLSTRSQRVRIPSLPPTSLPADVINILSQFLRPCDQRVIKDRHGANCPSVCPSFSAHGSSISPSITGSQRSDHVTHNQSPDSRIKRQTNSHSQFPHFLAVRIYDCHLATVYPKSLTQRPSNDQPVISFHSICYYNPGSGESGTRANLRLCCLVSVRRIARVTL